MDQTKEIDVFTLGYPQDPMALVKEFKCLYRDIDPCHLASVDQK